MSNVRSMAARVLATDSAGLTQAGELLRAGRLVAFPTETVYGLGAHALDASAVLSIFRAKGRPLTDPLIVHVVSMEDALKRELVDLSPRDAEIAQALAGRFWPGPLTMVLKANEQVVPATITANTGMVGIRVPAHKVAMELLQHANVPVAAPSANRFGHVSPTCAQHVIDDLGESDIAVVDGGDCGSGACSVGIESTVIQIHNCTGDKTGGKDSLILFRKGGVSEFQIAKALKELGFGEALEIKVPQKKQSKVDDTAKGTDTALQPDDADTVGHAAPGQSVTHYAPDVDTRLVMTVDSDVDTSSDSPAKLSDANDEEGSDVVRVAGAVVIDFGGRLKQTLGAKALAYRDLSETGDSREAATQLFSALRWTESVEGAKHVLIADVLELILKESSSPGDSNMPCQEENEKNMHVDALADRMFRAASGKRVRLVDVVVE